MNRILNSSNTLPPELLLWSFPIPFLDFGIQEGNIKSPSSAVKASSRAKYKYFCLVRFFSMGI